MAILVISGSTEKTEPLIQAISLDMRRGIGSIPELGINPDSIAVILDRNGGEDEVVISVQGILDRSYLPSGISQRVTESIEAITRRYLGSEQEIRVRYLLPLNRHMAS